MEAFAVMAAQALPLHAIFSPELRTELETASAGSGDFGLEAPGLAG
jgi:hypothetical protein